MSEENKNTDRSEFTEEESSFDIMEWVMLFVNHWYLFVISVAIMLFVGYMQNRKWLPVYKSTATIIIDESRSGLNSAQAMMQGFGVQGGYKNVNNQVLMIRSYDLMTRIVDSLPQFQTEYISKGRFKKRNLYGFSPIKIESDYISPEAYGALFKISIRNNGYFVITEDEERFSKDFRIEGRLGVPLQHHLMFVTISSLDNHGVDRELFFRFRTKESLIGEFSSKLNLGFVMDGSSVLEISMHSETPQRDVDFINKLCDIYLLQNLERKNDAATRTIDFINEQLEHVSVSLSTSEEELSNFRRQNQLVDVSSLSGSLIGKTQNFESELNQIRLKETYLAYLEKYINTNLNEGVIIAPSNIGISEPMLMSMVQQINDLLMKRSELTEKNMFYARYTKEIDNAKQAIDEVVKNMKVSIDIQKKDIHDRMEEVQKQIQSLPEKELDMIAIERKYRMNDSYYTMFLQKRSEAQILKASNTPDNNVLDRARTITVTNTGTKKKTNMMFLLIGLLIPSAFVILKELLNNTIRTGKDVEKYSAFPLIGLVRHTESDSPHLVINNPRSTFTEMFRVIRTRVEFLVKRKTDIAIMVTSTESGDGKTYFSINLAGVYSMASPKTILVDLDIRKPSIYQRLGCENEIGVSNFLANQCSLDDIIVRPEGAEFDFITGGTVPPNAGELIRSDDLISMLDELRKRYEYVIIDTSPIGVVADAYSLASLSDINLFIIRSNKTNKNFVRNLSNQLKGDKVKNFYSILNDVEVDSNRYSRYYSRKYVYERSKNYGIGVYAYTSYNRGRSKDSDHYFQYYQDDLKDL